MKKISPPHHAGAGQPSFANVHYFRDGRRARAFVRGRNHFNALAGGFSRFRSSWGKVLRIMPRRSDADLSIVPMLPGKGQPRTAQGARSDRGQSLERRRRRLARPMDRRLPRQIVLRRLVAQARTIAAERVEGPVIFADLAMREDDPEALEAEQVPLPSMHRETAKSVIHGLTALRATPRSRMAPREGGQAARGAGAFRPWEIVAKE